MSCVQFGGHMLPLHSQVLATNCSVLRSAFASTPTAERAAAVEVALAGEPPEDVRLFLRLVYDGVHVKNILEEAVAANPRATKGVLRMADKVGARRLLLEVSQHRLKT